MSKHQRLAVDSMEKIASIGARLRQGQEAIGARLRQGHEALGDAAYWISQPDRRRNALLATGGLGAAAGLGYGVTPADTLPNQFREVANHVPGVDLRRQTKLENLIPGLGMDY